MQALGAAAPDFELTDVISGNLVSLRPGTSGVATVVMFICNHCPYVRHIIEEVVRLANDYQPADVSFVAINSNDANEYPEDAPIKMKDYAERYGYPFPYLYDEDQTVAKAYDAACTPDFFVYDSDLKLVYRGRMDGATPGNDVPVTGKELRAALDALLSGDQPPAEQHPSIGCSIKWKS